MKKPLLKFKEQGKDHRNKNIYYVFNHADVFLGVINNSRVGRFMHWTFIPEKDTYYTNGCLKEIVEFITLVYNQDKTFV